MNTEPKKYLHKTILFSFLFILSMACFSATSAVAETKTLMISPVRAIFMERQRTVTLSVGNPSNAPVTYTVSLVTMRRDKSGDLYEVEKGAESKHEKLCRSMIRFSPRRATVQPHTRQVVKLMVRKPKDLPTGEYQTRLKIPPLAPVQSSQNSARQSDGRQFSINMLVGITLPVIIQHGPADTSLSPVSLQFSSSSQIPSGKIARLAILREGNYSGFGDIKLIYSSQGEQKAIGSVRGVAIYLPETGREVTIPLQDITSDELQRGSVRAEVLTYRGQGRRKQQKKQLIFKDFSLQ